MSDPLSIAVQLREQLQRLKEETSAWVALHLMNLHPERPGAAARHHAIMRHVAAVQQNLSWIEAYLEQE